MSQSLRSIFVYMAYGFKSAVRQRVREGERQGYILSTHIHILNFRLFRLSNEVLLQFVLFLFFSLFFLLFNALHKYIFTFVSRDDVLLFLFACLLLFLFGREVDQIFHCMYIYITWILNMQVCVVGCIQIHALRVSSEN